MIHEPDDCHVVVRGGGLSVKLCVIVAHADMVLVVVLHQSGVYAAVLQLLVVVTVVGREMVVTVTMSGLKREMAVVVAWQVRKVYDAENNLLTRVSCDFK